MSAIDTFLFAVFTISSIVLGITLAFVLANVDMTTLLILTIIALIGTLVPLLIRGKCLMGRCEEEEEE